ncbi:uncharacterized protein LOC115455187 [Manduca sexta]|uniref:uncharacterized protein LOC115455187 n=1 Tax=Manduca sexta TaxID=7130 RepID=UPI001183EF90|nr:uncharacterized protein LOC115455187 [Manduca sexta]
MPSIRCGGCAKFLSPAEGVKCSICNAAYHRSCVGLPRGTSITSWRCPECTKNDRRDNKAETPVRGRADMGHSSDDLMSPGTVGHAENDMVASLSPAVATELRRFKEELCAEFRLMRHEVLQLRTEMAELKDSLKGCAEHMNSLEARVDALEHKLSEKASDKSPLEGVVAELKSQLNERDQELLLNDVEVTGIPESQEESTLHLVKVLSNKLGVAIDEKDIVHVERIGSTRRNREEPSEGTFNPAAQRPRSLVVRFARRATRDALLREARVRRGFNTSELGFGGPSRPAHRVYINERLTRTNRHIFYKARQAGSTHNWRYVWTKGGRVFARKEDGRKVERITCEDDISRIFG